MIRVVSYRQLLGLQGGVEWPARSFRQHVYSVACIQCSKSTQNLASAIDLYMKKNIMMCRHLTKMLPKLGNYD